MNIKARLESLGIKVESAENCTWRKQVEIRQSIKLLKENYGNDLESLKRELIKLQNKQ